jgi:hypothetical protein
MSRLIVLQDSALNQKDLSLNIEQYIQSINSTYKFHHFSSNLYSIVFEPETNGLVLLHRTLDAKTYRALPGTEKLWKDISLSKVVELTNTYDNVYIMVADIQSQVTDQWIVENMRYWHRDAQGNLIDCETGVQVNAQDSIVYCFNVLSLFKLNNLPVITAIVNNNLVISLIENDVVAGDITIRPSTSDIYLKDQLFKGKVVGAEEIIGRETIFTKSKSLRVEWFSEIVQKFIRENNIPVSDLIAIQKISTNLPYQNDGFVATFDLSGVPEMSTSYIRLEVLAHDFLQRFIYETQKSYFEYNVYKMRG